MQSQQSCVVNAENLLPAKPKIFFAPLQKIFADHCSKAILINRKWHVKGVKPSDGYHPKCSLYLAPWSLLNNSILSEASQPLKDLRSAGKIIVAEAASSLVSILLFFS